MNLDLEAGQKVILDLGVESFVGEIHSNDINLKRIRLKNVENLQTKCKFNGIQNFFLSEIKSIIPFYDKTVQINKATSILNGNNLTNNQKNIDDTNNNEYFQNVLGQNEWTAIDSILKNTKLICQNDSSYFNAIIDLNNQTHIVVNLENCQFGRHNNSTIITIYAPDTNNLYIFDIMYLQGVYKELKNIFEAKTPRKIMFDSNVICDHLKFEQNIKSISGVFDVLVAYLVTFKEEDRLDILSCIHRFFSLPENYFNSKVKFNWNLRPLDEDHQQFTTKKVIFLYKLYEHLLHEHLLKSFYQTCEKFSSTYPNNHNNIDVAHLMSNKDKTADKLTQETNIDLTFSIDQLQLN